MKRMTMVLLAGLSLAACAPQVTPDQQALLEEMASRPVTCKTVKDCDEKWNRAIEWVSHHSKQKIKTITDNLIQAHTVSAADTRPVVKSPEFSVIRYRQGSGYIMEFSSYCDDGFACNPSGLKLRADFVTFIMGLPPGVVEARPGVFQKKMSQ